jgi:hypothetical protein
MRFVRDMSGKVRLHVALQANAHRGMTLVASKMGVYGLDRRDRCLDTCTSLKTDRSVKSTIFETFTDGARTNDDLVPA